MKKIFRKVSAAVTALAVMFTAVFVFDVPKLVASAAMSVPMGNLSSKGYYIDANYNLTIANNTGMENWFNDTGIDSSLLGSISNLSDRRALRGLVASIEIQSGVTKITQNAFESCAAITSITIPESVTSIEAKAFGSCRELKSVEIKGNITAISNWTFGSCFKLESITIPKSVTGIGSNAFYDCRAIKSITIPSNVTSIGSGAFDYCQALATMNIENETSVVELGDYGFNGNPFAKSNGKINVPCNLVESYKTAKNWSKYAAQIQPSHLNTVIKNAKDATCGAKGYTGDTYCKVCDALIASGTDIPATGEHDYSICFPYSPSPGTYHVFQCSICKDQKSGYFRHSGGTATCTKKAVCSECNREYGSLAAHTTTHTATKAATCTANGNKEYWYCSTCRKYFSDSTCTTEITKDSTVTAATGHSYKTTWSSDDVNHWHECTKCGDKKDKTPHPWGNWTLKTKPDLTTTGTAERTCSCGEKQTKTGVPKLTDTTVWTKGGRTNPTENGTGTQTYTSADYGTVTITVPKLSDDTVWSKETTPATEDAPGKVVYTSSDYGTVEVVIPQLAHTHTWGAWNITTSPTLTKTGSVKRTCTKDSSHAETKTVPKLTDTTVWTKGGRTEPTLNGTGSQTYTSADYGDVTITVPKLTDDTVWTKDDTQHVDATEEEDGKDVYTSPDYGEVTVILTALGHTHIWGDWEITKAPAMDEKGTAKRVCTGNNAHTETKTLPVLTDTNVWTKDSNKHVEPTEQAEGKDVYTSEYGEVTVTLGKLPHEHRLTLVDEVPATEEKEGIKEHWHCDGCDKDFADENGTKEVTADDLKIGKIETEVQAPANVPKTEIATSKEELISAVLTEEEQEKVKEGTDIKIILKIEDASESTPAEDKEKIDTAIGGLEDHKLGLYLDITLLKKIGGQEHEAITSTSKPITVTFKIPEALRGMAKYSVIRIHNGETTVLEDEDSNPGTVTIKTDKFSTYALTYQDKAEVSDPSGDDNSNSSSDNTSSGNDNSESGENNSNSSSDNTSSGNGNSESGDKNSDNNNSDTVSSENDNSNSSGSSSDETAQTPSGENSALSGGDTGEQHGNPSTGIAISFVPLAAALAAAALAVKRKKK